MSESFRLYRRTGFRNTFYTKCINVAIDSIGPSIILRSICQYKSSKGSKSSKRFKSRKNFTFSKCSKFRKVPKSLKPF